MQLYVYLSGEVGRRRDGVALPWFAVDEEIIVGSVAMRLRIPTIPNETMPHQEVGAPCAVGGVFPLVSPDCDMEPAIRRRT